MFVFSYSDAWADLVVQQLNERLGPDPTSWGYVCLCVGREFEELIHDNYEAFNEVSGKHLHIFTLLSPPWAFAQARAAMAEAKGMGTLAARIRETATPQPRGTQISEKVALLKDLTRVGLKADQYADFIFFDFDVSSNWQVDIDVVAVKTAPKPSNEEEALQLFAHMAKVAERKSTEGCSAEEFVASMNWKWSIRVALKSGMNLSKYVSEFLSSFRRLLD